MGTITNEKEPFEVFTIVPFKASVKGNHGHRKGELHGHSLFWRPRFFRNRNKREGVISSSFQTTDGIVFKSLHSSSLWLEIIPVFRETLGAGRAKGVSCN